MRLNQPLPEIGIPLLPGDADVRLDLQAVLQRTYDAGPYRREIDYRRDAPIPPVGPEWEDWLRQVLAGVHQEPSP